MKMLNLKLYLLAALMFTAAITARSQTKEPVKEKRLPQGAPAPPVPPLPPLPPLPAFDLSGDLGTSLRQLKSDLTQLQQDLKTRMQEEVTYKNELEEMIINLDSMKLELDKMMKELEKNKLNHNKQDIYRNIYNTAGNTWVKSGGDSIMVIVVDSGGKTGGKVYSLGNMKFMFHDKTRHINPDSIEDPKPPKNVQTAYLHMDLGFNAYLYQGNLTLPKNLDTLSLVSGKSINFNLHLIDQRVNLIRRKLWFGYGLHLDFNHYRFDNQGFSLDPNSDSLRITPLDYEIDRVKLVTKYLLLPFNLQFESNPLENSRSFKASAGLYAAYLVNAKMKLANNPNYPGRVYDDFNLEKLRLGVTARIGYGKFNLYANYSLSDMFAKDRGPALNPVAVGIQLIGF
jgi:regulator of replication initiation timing